MKNPIVLALLPMLLAACGGGGGSPGTPTGGGAIQSPSGSGAQQRIVEYSADGSGTTMDVSYFNPETGSTATETSTNFGKSFHCQKGDSLFVSATTRSTDPGTRVTVTIKLDSSLANTATQTGANVTATANASC